MRPYNWRGVLHGGGSQVYYSKSGLKTIAKPGKLFLVFILVQSHAQTTMWGVSRLLFWHGHSSHPNLDEKRMPPGFEKVTLPIADTEYGNLRAKLKGAQDTADRCRIPFEDKMRRSTRESFDMLSCCFALFPFN